MSRLCGNSYDFASVASTSVNLKCYKTAEGYEDTLHLLCGHSSEQDSALTPKNFGLCNTGHDEKTPLSDHLLLQAFRLDYLVCICSGRVSIVVCKYVVPPGAVHDSCQYC